MVCLSFLTVLVYFDITPPVNDVRLVQLSILVARVLIMDVLRSGWLLRIKLGK